MSAEKSPIVVVPILEDKIKLIAYYLGQKNIPWKDLVWYVSEFNIRFRNAMDPNNNPLEGKKLWEVSIDTSKIIKSPIREDVLTAAKKLAEMHPTIQELHYFLALRQYLYGFITAS